MRVILQWDIEEEDRRAWDGAIEVWGEDNVLTAHIRNLLSGMPQSLFISCDLHFPHVVVRVPFPLFFFSFSLRIYIYLYMTKSMYRKHRTQSLQL